MLSTLEAPQDETSDFHKIMANLYLRKHHMEEAVDELKKALGFRKRVVVPYVCTRCRQESSDWSGRCQACGLWNTYVALPCRCFRQPTRTTITTRVHARFLYQGIASPFETVCIQDDEKGLQLCSRLRKILNVPQRVRFRLFIACGRVG